jgi:hypothetical protein
MLTESQQQWPEWNEGEQNVLSTAAQDYKHALRGLLCHITVIPNVKSRLLVARQDESPAESPRSDYGHSCARNTSF